MSENRTIDLHVHSTASDGTFTPKSLLTEAKKAGLCAIALTDHDTMDGIAQAAAAAAKANIEFVPGIEFSTTYQQTEVHVLGYYVSSEYLPLQKKLEEFRAFRDTRNEQMIKKLTAHGFSITLSEIQARFPDSVITRAHLARFLFETGQLPDIRSAFARYIGEGCCCYVSRPKVTPLDAVTLIRAAGGTAVLAHPVMYHKMTDEQLKQLVWEMKEAGMSGIEAVYSENTPADEARFRELAASFDLFITGGSDFHGANKPHIQLGIGKGNLSIPYALLQALKDSRSAG